VTNTSKNPSPLNCLENNFLVSVEREYYSSNEDWSCDVTYRIPVNSQNAKNWSCSSIKTNKKYSYTNNYIKDFKRQKKLSEISDCGTENVIELDSSSLIFNEYKTKKIYKQKNEEEEGKNEKTCIKSNLIRTISYKKIPSFLEHKSPTI
jgi:hypothetical protein